MKTPLLIGTLAATLFVGLMAANAADPKPEVKCSEVIAKLEADIAKDPTRVLLAVEDALTTNDACSCDIIKTAITISKADHKLVGEIVSTAINTSPTTASTIGECALTAAPGAAKEIKAAMQAALGQGDGGGKEPITSGKEPITAGKEPIMGKDVVTAPPVAPESDFGPSPVEVTGIYFSPPASGPPGVEKPPIIKVVRSCDCRHKKKPHTGSTPATGS